MENKHKSSNDLQAKSKEKRDVHRQRVLKSGVILFNNGYSSFDCRVKNQHDNGVMLEYESTLGIPNEFEFRLNGQAGRVPARVVWRSESRMGVAFNT